MYGQGVRYFCLVHLDLIRIVDDDVELSEPTILDQERCCQPVQYFTSRCRSMLVMVFRIVLDDLVDARHLESVVQVSSQEGRGEQDLIASITAHDNAPQTRHDVVFFGVSAHERTDIVARQTDVLEHGLHLGKVRT